MDARIFASAAMGLREDMLGVPLAQRFAYDAQKNLLFVNFEGHTVRSLADVQAVREQVEQRVAALGRRVDVIVNYDHFTILPDVLDAYSDMVSGLVQHHYASVARYTTSSFLRMKLGDALKQRGVAPHIVENAAQARENVVAQSR